MIDNYLYSTMEETNLIGSLHRGLLNKRICSVSVLSTAAFPTYMTLLLLDVLAVDSPTRLPFPVKNVGERRQMSMNNEHFNSI